jgi:hypothetical protein
MMLVMIMMISSIFAGTPMVVEAASGPTGSGTQDDPYEISSVADLKWLADNQSQWNKHFIQTTDIDLNVSPYNSGAGWVPIGNESKKFTGVYDGRGHKIENLMINQGISVKEASNPQSFYLGLFGYVDGGVIVNVGVENVHVKGAGMVGALAGMINNNSIVSNTYATGTVEGRLSVGGLIGRAYLNSVISGSHADVTVVGHGTQRYGGAEPNRNVWNGGLVGIINTGTVVKYSYATGEVSGGREQTGGLIGGVWGASSASRVENCSARGDVSGEHRVGGLIGNVNRSMVKYSYSTGRVSAIETTYGGLVGYQVGASSSYNFWDTGTSGISRSAIGTGKSTIEMKTASTYSAWDSSYGWEINNGNYPYFKIPLTISGSFTINDKIYDGTTNATIDQNNLRLASTRIGHPSSDVSLNPVAVFENNNIGTNKEVNLKNPTLNGIDRDKYFLILDCTPSATADIKPKAPTNPSENDANNTFGWTNVAGYTKIDDYEYSIDGGTTWTDTTKNPQPIPDEDIAIGKVQVRVKADGKTGRPAGAVIRSRTAFAKTLQAPSIQLADIGDTTVRITWNPIEEATGYQIYQSTTSGLYQKAITTVSGAVYGYEFTGLTNENTYFFTVKASNGKSVSDYSNELSATPKFSLAKAPVLTSVTGDDRSAKLTWNEFLGATAYEVYKRTETGIYDNVTTTVSSSVYQTVSSSVYETVGSSDYQCNIPDLTNGTKYFFVIRAVNSVEKSPFSNELSVVPKTVPQAPINVIATAGNGQAAISFTPSSDNGGSEITRYTITSDPGNIQITTTSTNAIITGLTNGITYTFTVQAENIVGKGGSSKPSNEVKPVKPSNGNDNDTGSTSGNTQKPNQSEKEKIIVIVNGKEKKAGKEIIKEENGKKTVELVVDGKVLNQKIEEIIKVQQNLKLEEQIQNIVEVPVKTEDAGEIITALTGDIVKKMEEHAFSLAIKANNIDYRIPAKEIGIEKVAKTLGVKKEALEEIKVEIKIDKLGKKITEQIKEKAKDQNYEMVLPPIDFTIVAKTTTLTGDKEDLTISRFSQYVERFIEIPEGVDPNKITTGIVYNEDGIFSHIPTDVIKKENKYFAKLNSLTNSTYSVIYNPITVPSVESHWSRKYINDMASRLVIKNPESFTPDGEITRGEFAEYITKALGLYRTNVAKTKQFKDVETTDQVADAISIAVENHIINGYPDGTFKPNAKITRQEAMVMYATAMDIVKIQQENPDRIKTYQDGAKVSKWAYNSVKKVLSSGVFNGRSEDTIEPKGTFTYAEAATALRNLLVKSKLINQ